MQKLLSHCNASAWKANLRIDKASNTKLIEGTKKSDRKIGSGSLFVAKIKIKGICFHARGIQTRLKTEWMNVM